MDVQNWLFKYDTVVKCFYNYYLENNSVKLENYNMYIRNFILYGNSILHGMDISTNVVKINNKEYVERCLYKMLFTLFKYDECKNKRCYDGTLTMSRNLFIKKNEDYGDSFTTYNFIGVLVRLQDKVNRLENLINKDEKNIKYESIEDSMIDSINYCILGLMLI